MTNELGHPAQHHGQRETIVYVLEKLLRWGHRGKYSAKVRAGDFRHPPSRLPHQELNPSNEQPFRWIVVRSTPEPIVVNLPDDNGRLVMGLTRKRSCG